MASIIIFPTVATHRRLPHLPPKGRKEPKEPENPKEPETPNDDLSTAVPHDHGIPTSRRKDEAAGVPSSDMSQFSIALTSVATGHQLPQSQTGALETKVADLTLDTNYHLKASEGVVGSGAPTEAIALSSGADEPLQGDERPVEHDNVVRGHQLRAHAPSSPPTPLHGPHGQSPLSTPMSVATSFPPGTLALSGVPSSSSSSPSTPAIPHHESKSIKSALYDAFGCLHHPVQHTHHPSSAMTSTTFYHAFPSTSACGPSTHHHNRLSTTVALRSSEGVSMVGTSSGGSPILRPHLGASAPITPLDLPSTERHSSHGGGGGGSGGGYFWPSTPGGSSGTGSRHHFFTQHTHPHSHPHPNLGRRTSSFHLREGPLHFRETTLPNNSQSSRRSSLDAHHHHHHHHLNPAEHPVLCSLQPLDWTHSHPAEHRHLGHDVGQGRVPVVPMASTNCLRDNVKGAAIVAQTSATQQAFTQPPASSTFARVASQLQEQQHQQHHQSLTKPPGGASLFPMDRGSDDASIGRFGQQELV